MTRGSDGLNDAAATQLFLALRRPVRHYLFGILNDPAEAEDLTQEAFLRLHSELLKGGEIESIRAWVFQVAHNLAIDHQRRTRLLDQLDNTAWEQKMHPGPGVEERLMRKHVRRHIAAMLGRLSARERRCVELRAEGLRYREIAGMLGIGITSVENYWARAVKKIAASLEGPPLAGCG
jgi:RNA polymerase sigma-70 factor (ECF subfamily)